jgi:hypothetical protein
MQGLSIPVVKNIPDWGSGRKERRPQSIPPTDVVDLDNLHDSVMKTGIQLGSAFVKIEGDSNHHLTNVGEEYGGGSARTSDDTIFCSFAPYKAVKRTIPVSSNNEPEEAPKGASKR